MCVGVRGARLKDGLEVCKNFRMVILLAYIRNYTDASQLYKGAHYTWLISQHPGH